MGWNAWASHFSQLSFGFPLDYWFHSHSIRNLSRSPLLSSWSISLLTSFTFNEKYRQSASVVLVHFSTDFIHFQYAMSAKGFDFLNDTFNNEYKQKSSVDFCLYWSFKSWGISEDMDQEPHKGLLFILLFKNVWNRWGNEPGAPQRTSGCTPPQRFMESVGALHKKRLLIFIIKNKRPPPTIPSWRCMESAGKWTSRGTEDFCLYSFLTVYGISKRAPQGTLADIAYWMYTGLLLTLLIKSVWNQKGNGPGASQRTSAHIPYWKCK